MPTFTVWRCPVTAPPSSLPSLLSPAVSALRGGGVVALPTETVYGLAGDALNDRAVRAIFHAKGRPSDNPLIVHTSSMEALLSFCAPLSPSESLLAEAFWPGPLTLLLRPRSDVALSPLVTAGHPRVAVRIPAHPIALAVLELSGLPLAAPSANLSGRPSPTSASHVVRDLGEGRGVSGVVDSGDAGVGVESSVVEVSEGGGGEVHVRILRPGAVTREELQAKLPLAAVSEAVEGEEAASLSSAPLAPGMKYSHYQPQAPFVLLEGGREWREAAVRAQVREGVRVGLLCSGEEAEHWKALQREVDGGECGSGSLLLWVAGEGLPGLARDLFRGLRWMDDSGAERIFTAVTATEGLGAALMNRMSKAAAGRRWKEGKEGTTEEKLSEGAGYS